MTRSLRIGYLQQQPLQDLPVDLGQRLNIVALFRALIEAGHQVTLLNGTDGRCVYSTTGEQVSSVPLRFTNGMLFRAVEAPIRRLQARLGIVGIGFFDSVRFAEACVPTLAACDVLHERFSMLRWGGMLARRVLGVPRVLHVHADELYESSVIGHPPPLLSRQLMRWYSRTCFRSADAIVAVSQAVKHRLVDHWGVAPSKIFVLPNAVEPVFFAPTEPRQAVRARLGLTDAQRIILFLGSFHWWYDLPTLVRAFARLRAHLPDAHLLLVGDGERRRETEALVRELALVESVTLTGCIEHAHIPGVVAAVDVAVVPVAPLTGEFWCSPMKLFEYMAAGKAIVASRAGQIAEILRDGHSGRLVPPGDTDALADALQALLESDADRVRLGENARRDAAQYMWPRYVERLTGVYEFAMAQRTTTRRQAR